MCVAYFTPHRLQDSQVQDHRWVQKLHWGTATGGHPRMFWSSPQCWHYVSLGRETSLKGCPLLVPHVVFVFTPVLMLHKSWYKNYMEVLLLVGSPECFGLIPPPPPPPPITDITSALVQELCWRAAPCGYPRMFQSLHPSPPYPIPPPVLILHRNCIKRLPLVDTA